MWEDWREWFCWSVKTKNVLTIYQKRKKGKKVLILKMVLEKWEKLWMVVLINYLKKKKKVKIALASTLGT